MEDNTIYIEFAGGQAKDGAHGCNYMLGRYEDEDGDEQELYAEVITPDDLDENDAEMFGWEELEAEIRRQAKEAGISEGRLEFE